MLRIYVGHSGTPPGVYLITRFSFTDELNRVFVKTFLPDWSKIFIFNPAVNSNIFHKSLEYKDH